LIHTVWWYHSAAALSAKNISATFTNTGGTTNQQMVAFGVNGCDLTTPFDVDASLPAESNSSSGGTRTAHNVTFSTTNPNTFVFEVEAADTTSYSNPGDDAGWTLIVDQGGGGYGQTYVAYQVYTSAQSSVTQNVWAAQTTAEGDIASIDALQAAAATGSTGVWDSTEAIDALAATGSPIIDSAWASTEAIDVFAASGSPIIDAAWTSTEAVDVFAAIVYEAVDGPWISTDTKDTLAAAGGPVANDGPWHSVDAKDVLAATGGPVLGGPWHSTDAKDTFAAVGYPVSVGLWISLDKRDRFAAAGYTPAIATWASTDAKDIFVSPIPATWQSTDAADRLAAAAYTPGESMEWVSIEPVDTVNATGYTTDHGSWTSPEAKDIFSAIGAGASAPKGRRIFLAC
jgi:hypothetical protein